MGLPPESAPILEMATSGDVYRTTIFVGRSSPNRCRENGVTRKPYGSLVTACVSITTFVLERSSPTRLIRIASSDSTSSGVIT